jgi:HSP20 family protein
MLWPERYRGGLEPFRELQHLKREMDRLFSGVTQSSVNDFPLINIWTSGDDAIVTAELPGLSSNEIDISVIGNTLMLSGVRTEKELKGDKTYHRRERGYGQFSRSIQMPFKVEAEKVSAKYNDGVLHITLPRAEEDKPKKILIKAE